MTAVEELLRAFEILPPPPLWLSPEWATKVIENMANNGSRHAESAGEPGPRKPACEDFEFIRRRVEELRIEQENPVREVPQPVGTEEWIGF